MNTQPGRARWRLKPWLVVTHGAVFAAGLGLGAWSQGLIVDQERSSNGSAMVRPTQNVLIAQSAPATSVPASATPARPVVTAVLPSVTPIRPTAPPATPTPDLSGSPAITLTTVPPRGAQGGEATLVGRVSGVNPADHKVVVYIYLPPGTCSPGWWGPKPTWDPPLTSIKGSGVWEVNIATGNCDADASKVAAYLVRDGFVPPRATGMSTLGSSLRQALATVEHER
jgi:hypothetical protein